MPLPAVRAKKQLRGPIAGAVLLIAAFGLTSLAGCLSEVDRGRATSTVVRATSPAMEPARPADGAQTVRRYALQLLLVPLLDDDLPSRWAVRTAADPCLESESTLVDGKDLDGGTPIPALFMVVRRFDGCRLFGDHRLELTGTVSMAVAFDGKQRFTATVDARALRVRAVDGAEVPVGGVFTAGEQAQVSTGPLASSTGDGIRHH